MTNQVITIVDYGMGNLWSVQSALRYLGCQTMISSDPEKIAGAEALILPGVGSFRKAMKRLQQNGIDQAIDEAVKRKGRKILGICLGMQLMGLSSTEDGDTTGLGLINCIVEKFKPEEVGTSKLPHIGFDVVRSQRDSLLFRNLQTATDFYFVHSYRMLPAGLNGVTALCEYGTDFLAAYEQDNIYSTQFHPEKSQTNGLILLKNFLEL
jgi:glutamine amidotransferase